MRSDPVTHFGVGSRTPQRAVEKSGPRASVSRIRDPCARSQTGLHPSIAPVKVAHDTDSGLFHAMFPRKVLPEGIAVNLSTLQEFVPPYDLPGIGILTGPPLEESEQRLLLDTRDGHPPTSVVARDESVQGELPRAFRDVPAVVPKACVFQTNIPQDPSGIPEAEGFATTVVVRHALDDGDGLDDVSQERTRARWHRPPPEREARPRRPGKWRRTERSADDDEPETRLHPGTYRDVEGSPSPIGSREGTAVNRVRRGAGRNPSAP
jgi:hypothetical protein